MSTVFHTLTDLELLRFARASNMMDSPLFAEIIERFEETNFAGIMRELRFRNKQPYRLAPDAAKPQISLLEGDA